MVVNSSVILGEILGDLATLEEFLDGYTVHFIFVILVFVLLSVHWL